VVEHGERAQTRDILKAVKPYTKGRRAVRHAFSPERAALLVIDMQRYFLDESSHAYLPEARHIVGNVQELVSACRRRSVPILFTRHAHRGDEDPGMMGSWWGDVIRDGTEASMLDSRLSQLPSEKVLRKTRYSAFAGTGLEKWLQARKVTQVLISGVMTHLCCESTARDAFMKGFEVFFVIDGTASKNLDLHVSSIKTLTDGFAIPVTTKEVLTWLSG
jgi:isochorismate hydrolase